MKKKLTKERREFLLKRIKELKQKNLILYKARDITIKIIDLRNSQIKKMGELLDIELRLKELEEKRSKMLDNDSKSKENKKRSPK